MVKVQSISTFIFTNFRSHSHLAEGQILFENDTTPRMVTFY